MHALITLVILSKLMVSSGSPHRAIHMSMIRTPGQIPVSCDAESVGRKPAARSAKGKPAVKRRSSKTAVASADPAGEAAPASTAKRRGRPASGTASKTKATVKRGAKAGEAAAKESSHLLERAILLFFPLSFGAPCRIKESFSGFVDLCHTNHFLYVDLYTPAPAAKKRGRPAATDGKPGEKTPKRSPRKKAAADDDINHDSPELAATAGTAKRRGRPPKSEASGQQTADACANGHSSAMAPAAAMVSKRRGRPPKAAPAAGLL